MKPGDVAMITEAANPDAPEWAAVKDEKGWASLSPEIGWLGDDDVLSARPLILIDPEDRERVGELRMALNRKGVLPLREEDFWRLQGALRSLVAPPRPDEPSGLGAVVEDTEGVLWVKSGAGDGIDSWHRQGDVHARWYRFDDFAAVRVLSEGVTS